MRPPIVHLACFTLALASMSITPRLAHATWVPLGNAVCVAPGDQIGGSAAPDGSGGMFVVWLDQRRGYPPNTDLYGTRLLADGTVAPGWPVDGAALAATGHVTTPSLAPDGAGGLLLIWFDQTDYKPRMQHVDASGVPAPGFPADGLTLPIVVGGPTGYIVRAGSDGAGGAYVLWNNFNGSADVALVTRVTGAGGFAPGWNASGVPQAYSDFFNPFTGFSGLSLQIDPTGGTLVGATWPVEDFPVGSHVSGQICRTLATGSVAFATFVSPLPSASGFNLTPDVAGGAFATRAAAEPPTLRMQHYLANGSAAWPSTTAAPVSGAMVTDGSGGLYLFAAVSAPDRLVLHRRAADASIPPPWTADGVVLNQIASGFYFSKAIFRSGSLLYACWSSGDPSAIDLRALAVTADGEPAPGWTPGGMTVCGAAGNQVLTAFGPFSTDQAVAVWEDRRAWDSDIYVTLLQPGGPVTLDAPGGRPGGPASLAFAAAPAPNPSRDLVGFSFTLASEGSATLEIVDAAGRVHGRLAPGARIGAQSLTFDVTRLPSGIYWVCLRQGPHAAVRRFAVLH
jgi:hypothetical protein